MDCLTKFETMPILQIALILVVIGVLLYLANRFIPMQPTMKNILNWVVIGATVIWLVFYVFDLWNVLGGVRV